MRQRKCQRICALPLSVPKTRRGIETREKTRTLATRAGFSDWPRTPALPPGMPTYPTCAADMHARAKCVIRPDFMLISPNIARNVVDDFYVIVPADDNRDSRAVWDAGQSNSRPASPPVICTSAVMA
jgi:hypothetical protein